MKDINFLFNESMSEKFEEGEKEKKAVSGGRVVVLVLTLFVATALLLIPGAYVRILKGQVASVEQSLQDAKYDEVRAAKARLDQIRKSVESKKAVIRDIDKKSVPASQILLITEQAIPAGCYYSSINYGGTGLRISGRADSGLVVAELIGNLDRLHTLTRKTETVQFEQAQSPVDFNVEYTVKGGN